MATVKIPAVLFGFNRPDLLRTTIGHLRALEPPEVWFFIDGPRADRAAEPALCAEAAGLVSLLDWGCKVVVKRNTANKGLRSQIRDGLTDFFRAHEAGLIVEDDICIAPGAAHYINEAVSRIDGKKIAAASLNNFLIPGRSYISQPIRDLQSPYLSSLFHCWGWVATRDGWSLYQDDIELECDREYFDRVEAQFAGFPHITPFWQRYVHWLRGGLSSWACRYQLSLWKAGARCLVPPVNLAVNIGFGAGATHTLSAPAWSAEWKLEDAAITFPAKVPHRPDCDIEELGVTENMPPQIHCRWCGGLAQKVFTSNSADLPRSFYECSECACLQTTHRASFAGETDEIPPNSAFEAFNRFVIAKNTLGILNEGDPHPVLVSDDAFGLLTRLLRNTGVDAYAVDSNGAKSFAGNHFWHSAEEAMSRLGDRSPILVAFDPAADVDSSPRAYFDAAFSHRPLALLFSAELYQGQTESWEAAADLPRRRTFFLSAQAMGMLAQDSGYQWLQQDNLHLFIRHGYPRAVQKALADGALRQTLYAEGGLNRLLGYLSNTAGLAADDRSQRERQGRDRSPPAARIYLNKADSGRLFVDCMFFQMASTGIAKLWNEVFRIWAERYRDRVVLLDRGGDIEDFGLARERLPRFSLADPMTGIRGLTWHLMRGGACALLSTYYTFCEHLPTRAVVYDMIPETLGFSGSEWDLKRAYLQRAQGAHCISRSTFKGVLQHFPHLKNAAYYRLTGISPVFQPLGDEQRAEVRRALNVERKHLFVLPCVLGGYKDGITALQAASMLPFASEIEVISTVPVPDPEAVSRMFPQLRIRFNRFATDLEFARLLAAADLLLWPSRMEGIGYPPMEAVASGTRMVCIRNDVNQEVYGDAAIYAEAGDPASFAQAIGHALAGPLNPKLSEIVAGVRDYETYATELFNFGYYGHPAGEGTLEQTMAA